MPARTAFGTGVDAQIVPSMGMEASLIPPSAARSYPLDIGRFTAEPRALKIIFGKMWKAFRVRYS